MFSAGNVVGSTFLGWFSDKYGRKPTMVIGLFGSALGYALLVFSTSVWQVIGARFLAGIFGGTVGVSNAYVADLSKPSERVKHLGRLNSLASIGFATGPALGALAAQIGFAAACTTAAVLSGINCLIAVFALKETLPAKSEDAVDKSVVVVVPEEKEDDGTTSKSAAASAPATAGKLSFKEVFWTALTDRGILLLLVSRLLAGIGEMPVWTVLPVYGEDYYDMTPASLGILFTGAGVCCSIVSLLDKLIRRVASRFGAACCYAGIALMSFLVPFSPNLAILVAAAILQAGFQVLIIMFQSSLMSVIVGPAKQGSLMGLFFSFSAMAKVIGPSLLGALYEIHFLIPFAVGGGCYMICMGCAFGLPRPPAGAAMGDDNNNNNTVSSSTPTTSSDVDGGAGGKLNEV